MSKQSFVAFYRRKHRSGGKLKGNIESVLLKK